MDSAIGREIWVLAGTAASVGFIHTLLGPDHYLPFIAMSRARGWRTARTVWITIFCGIGHVLSSVVLGSVGIALGIAVSRLEALESVRGSLAGWALLGFGLAYTVWGIRQAIRNRPHRHRHAHGDGSLHEHEHTHQAEHAHVHERRGSLTPWVLFVIFALGPCEPLIPILMVPAAQESVAGLVLVTAVFGVVTISTMVAVTLLGVRGTRFLPARGLERYAHAAAGFAILLCGVAMQFLGL